MGFLFRVRWELEASCQGVETRSRDSGLMRREGETKDVDRDLEA